MIKKLTAHPSAQCHVEIDSMYSIHFYSYRTEVITISSIGWLMCHGLYSATTRKQIGWFMREYCEPLNYYDAKRAYTDGILINVYTGQSKPFETA